MTLVLGAAGGLLAGCGSDGAEDEADARSESSSLSAEQTMADCLAAVVEYAESQHRAVVASERAEGSVGRDRNCDGDPDFETDVDGDGWRDDHEFWDVDAAEFVPDPAYAYLYDEAETPEGDSDASSSGYWSTSFTAIDVDGYEVGVDLTLTMVDWSLDPTDAKPGETIATLDLDSSLTVTNLTPQRQAPGLDFGDVRLLYPTSSLVCREGQAPRGLLTLYTKRYCGIAVRDDLYHENPALETPSLAPDEALQFDRSGTDPGLVEPLETTFPDDGNGNAALLEALASPVGVIVGMDDDWSAPEACEVIYYPNGSVTNGYSPIQVVPIGLGSLCKIGQAEIDAESAQGIQIDQP